MPGRPKTLIQRFAQRMPSAGSHGPRLRPRRAAFNRTVYGDPTRLTTVGAMTFQSLSLKKAEALPVVDGTIQWIPLRRRLGIRAFGTNAYRATRAGDDVIEDHVESPGQEEMYVVVAGRVRFTIDGEDVEADHGDVVFLPDPAVRRSGIALEDGTIVLGVGGWPDKPYHSLPWEPIFLAADSMDNGDWAAAAKILERESGDHREHPRVRYRLACCLTQLGNVEAALTELRAAVDAAPRLQDEAERDQLLAPLREHEGWPG